MCAERDDPHEDLLRETQEVLARLAQDLLKLPALSGALSAAVEAREHAAHAQSLALSALGVPSAADIERLTRRVRSVSERIEGVEDGIDRILERLDRLTPRTEPR